MDLPAADPAETQRIQPPRRRRVVAGSDWTSPAVDPAMAHAGCAWWQVRRSELHARRLLRRDAPIVGRGRPEPDKQAGLHGLARHKTGPWARAWAVGGARGLTRHGPLRNRAGPGQARR